MNLGSQRIMKMGFAVWEPLHCLAAQPREAAIFEGEPSVPVLVLEEKDPLLALPVLTLIALGAVGT